MADTDFKPVAFLKRGCPFCLKLRLFLLEAGLLDRVEIREFEHGSPEEQAIAQDLSKRLPRVGFPTVELTPGHYVSDSDAIIAWFGKHNAVDAATLTTFGDYVEGVFKRHLALYRENMDLKRGLTR